MHAGCCCSQQQYKSKLGLGACSLPACLPACLSPISCPRRRLLCPAVQVRIISFGVMLFLPMTIFSLAILLPINYTSGGRGGGG